jgi:carbonic anhydrase
MPKSFKELLEGNKKFVELTQESDPHFFENLSEGQHPKFLWIGCSDSRVPSSEITHTAPGTLFVHRNIANVVVHTDSNLLSVAYYAVKVLKVPHVIVCGHYGCGGIAAAMSHKRYGYIDSWLRHIKDVYRLHHQELEKISDMEMRTNRLVELNVEEQVKHLASVPFIQEEWENGEFPYIHGWVYDLKTGKIKDLGVTRNSTEGLDEVFDYEFSPLSPSD